MRLLLRLFFFLSEHQFNHTNQFVNELQVSLGSLNNPVFLTVNSLAVLEIIFTSAQSLKCDEAKTFLDGDCG